jgi:RHS repeat-associated protein
VYASYGDSTQLIYLRARYYNPVDGRFQSRDTWGGSANSPISFNRWNYGYSNPVTTIDPSGKSPACPLGGEACARQRLFEIVYAENPNNGAVSLVKIFEDSELTNLWGAYAGKTSGRRLEWLLRESKSDAVLPLYFGIAFGSDKCFSEEFRDSNLYPKWGLDPSQSNQVAHFLSAVGITYYGWSIGGLIGHEQHPDGTAENYFSYLTVTDEDYEHFYKAVKYDENGLFSKRDDELWAALHFDDPSLEHGDVDPSRVGNSLQDFRLSLKGYRFARWVKGNRSTQPQSAGKWLRLNLMSLPFTLLRNKR